MSNASTATSDRHGNVTATEDEDMEAFVELLHSEAVAREERLRAEKERLIAKRAVGSAAVTALETESLTEEQTTALQLALQGKSLFITGGAGTGKSLVLREILVKLREIRGGGSVYMTATTGVAALNVRGATLNSFSGVGFAAGTPEDVLKNVRKNRKASGRLAYCQTLIIDEISMLDVELFDKLNYVCQEIRKRRGEPFGGIQVILCGDFLQLPPIEDIRKTRRSWASRSRVKVEEMADCLQDAAGRNLSKKTYCFESEAWAALNPTTVVLHRKHRQGKDFAFQAVLDEVRMGTISRDSIQLLMARNTTVVEAAASATPDPTPEEKHYVRLCGTNKEVDARNASYFAALTPQTQPYDVTQITPTATGEDDRTEDPLRPLHIYTAADVLLNTNASGYGGTIVLPPQHSRSVAGNGDNFERTGHGHRGGVGSTPFSAGVRFEDSTLPTVLPLKVGTRVMLSVNVSTRLGLVNGSVGEVMGFLHPLEYIDLILRAGQERRQSTPRGQALLARAGFGTFLDAMRCVDTAHAQTLFGYLRGHHLWASRKGLLSVDAVSYGDVYGADHLADVLRLAGLDELATVDGDMIPVSRLSTPGDTASGTEREREADEGEAEDSGKKKQQYDATEEGLGFLDDLLGTSPYHAQTAAHGHGASVEADQLYLGGLLPLHMRMTRLPIVRFDLESLTQGDDTTTTPITGQALGRYPRYVYAFVSPSKQTWYMGSKPIASRTQIPLRHAWAITVHKSQGLTISQLQVDMRRFFSPGQAYVALSRATSLDNIMLLNFNAESVRTCPLAKEFYAGVEGYGGD